MKYPGTNFDVRVGDIAEGVVDMGLPEIYRVVGIISEVCEDKSTVYIIGGAMHVAAPHGGVSFPNADPRLCYLSSLNRILESGPQQV
jgi:hypothetical protein